MNFSHPNSADRYHRSAIIQQYRQRIAQGDRSKLSKSELEALIVDFIGQLATLKSKSRIATLCRDEIALLEEGYPQPTVGKVYLPMYRKAIKKAIDDQQLPVTKNTSHQYSYSKRTGASGSTIEHYALTFLKYDTATYGEFAAAAADRNNTKQDHLQPVELEAFLTVAADLLLSNNPFDLAAGIAAATGRRFSEVVAKGSFSLVDDPYWLSFAGQLKKRTKADHFLTPCLLPAAAVLAALERFRGHSRIIQLAQGTPDELNRSLADSVKRSVKSHFGKIVPVLPGEKAVTVHNLRGVYGQVCTHFFCPPDRTTPRFLQECLGHVISAEELKRGNSSATQFYFHYYLVDQLGQHLSAKGIKLGVQESGMELPTEQAQQLIPHDSSSNLQAEVSHLWAHLRQLAPPAPDLSADLAAAIDRITTLESALQNAHHRIDQLLSIVQGSSSPPSQPRPPASSKILAAINAIYVWNSQNPQKFAISQTLLLKSTGCNRPAIQRVLIDLQEEIDSHHASFSISPLSQPRNLDQIITFVQASLPLR
jgi:Telomere resolvase